MKKTISILLAICMMAALLAGCGLPSPAASAPEETTAVKEVQPAETEELSKETADLVVFGTIYTAEDENDGLAEAFAVKDGKYIYVGDRQGAEQFVEEGKTEVLDRTGEGLIIPGCTEGHSHYFDGTGLNSQLPGSECSYDEVLKILKERVETEGIKQFVSFGWKTIELNSALESGKNFAEEIESFAPGIPVVLIDNTAHNAVCNTTALKMAGLLENPHVRGGEVYLDKEGKPCGYVGDQVVFYVIDKVIEKPLTEEQYENACLYGMNTLLKYGYTNALDALLNMYHPTALYDALKKMDDAGELKINVSGCYNIKSYDADIFQKKVDEVADIVDHYSGKHFNPGYIKLFADGVVEEGTGWMLEEYKYAEPGKEHGNIVWEPDELNALVEYANSKGLLIHSHTYGDAACKALLDAYIASNEANGGKFRNSLGHVRNIQKEDIIRAAENDISIAENLIWHVGYDEMKPDELAQENDVLELVSEDTYYSGYPMKSLIENGVVISSSTDAPADVFVEGTIMNVLEVAVTGKQPNDGAKPFGEDELLTVREGLQALTINGAWQLGLEEERGSIKEGKFADFVILDKNILEYGEDQYYKIGDTKVLSTYFEGEKVYSAFSDNIDKYWKEHDIDGALAERGNSEEQLANTRAQMLAMYGENKEITGDYDEALAADTVSGTYVGQIVSDEVVSWKGIPYAKQPVGELRWRAPQAPDASDKVYEAYYFGHSSVQVEGGDEPASLYPQGEDCLNLNLWNNRADGTENKPIMVWIHGGAYIQGGACTDEYDGTNFVKNHPEVIFASIDYRTDYLGFINLSNVPGAEDYYDTANLGLMDEIQALAWLKENAAAFGGDPERITIFGESAGGGSVSALMLAPQAKGMFKRGIMQSGVSTAYLRTAKKSIARTDKMMEISGAKNLDDLLSLTKTDIRKLGTIIVSESGLDYTYPQRDGIVIPMDIREGLNSNQRNGFDILIGTTKNEYNYFTMILGKENNLTAMRSMIDEAYTDANDEQKARLDAFMEMQTADEYDNLLQFINYRSFHCPARYEAKTHAANGQNAYVYYFTEESNDPERLSDHGYDLGFVLGNVEEDRAKDIPAAWKLSEIMQQMWVNFAKTGDPSLNEGEVEGVDAIRWDKYQADDYKVMVLDSQGCQMESDPIREGSDLIEDLFWLRIKDE